MFSWLINNIQLHFVVHTERASLLLGLSKTGVFAKGLSSDKLESKGNRMASSFAFSIFVVKGNNGTKCTRFVFGSKSFAHYYSKVQLLLRKARLLGKAGKFVMV